MIHADTISILVGIFALYIRGVVAPLPTTCCAGPASPLQDGGFEDSNDPWTYDPESVNGVPYGAVRSANNYTRSGQYDVQFSLRFASGAQSPRAEIDQPLTGLCSGSTYDFTVYYWVTQYPPTYTCYLGVALDDDGLGQTQIGSTNGYSQFTGSGIASSATAMFRVIMSCYGGYLNDGALIAYVDDISFTVEDGCATSTTSSSSSSSTSSSSSSTFITTTATSSSSSSSSSSSTSTSISTTSSSSSTSFPTSTSTATSTSSSTSIPTPSSSTTLISNSSTTSSISTSSSTSSLSASSSSSSSSLSLSSSTPTLSLNSSISSGSVSSSTSSIITGTTSIGTSSSISSASLRSTNTPASTGTTLSSISSLAPASATQYTTSTVYTTRVFTITACPSTVTNCPAASTILITSTIALYTTVCPVTSPPYVSPFVSPKAASVAMTTLTVYTTKTLTIAACPASITNCPASSTKLITTVVPLYTTICPVASVAAIASQKTIIPTQVIISTVASLQPPNLVTISTGKTVVSGNGNPVPSAIVGSVSTAKSNPAAGSPSSSSSTSRQSGASTTMISAVTNGSMRTRSENLITATFMSLFLGIVFAFAL